VIRTRGIHVVASRRRRGALPAWPSRGDLTRAPAHRVAHLAPWLLAGTVLIAFGPALGRSFTSEDFLLIRVLGEHPPWRDPAAWLAAPWLGISAVKFWRPVSTLLYALEIAVFGVRPLGYNLAHLLVHALNAVLVWALVRRLDRKREESGDGLVPLVAAALFAIHPLHPNAVVFGASFATLFGAAFQLGAFLAWLRFRQDGSHAAWWTALGLFALALGSYEASAILPVVLVLHDHLLAAPGRDRHRVLVPGYVPFFAVLGGYLLLRRWILGVVLGGYEEFAQRLVTPQMTQLLADAATSVRLLHVPVYDRGWTRGIDAGALALLLGAPLVLFALRRRTLAPVHARLWLFAWGWGLAMQAPFAFRPSVPANGRYWYLASAGVALSAVVLGRAVFIAGRSRARVLAPVTVLLLGLGWAWLLADEVRTYREAARAARDIQQQLIRIQGAGEAASGRRLFLTRYPYFLVNEAQVPLAQVYHYGLRDAVNPPFSAAAVPVWPLVPLQGPELLPVALGPPGSGIFEWDATSGTIRPAAIPRPDPPLVELRVLAPRDGALVDPARETALVAIPPGPHHRFRLLVTGPGNGTVVGLGPDRVADGVLRADLPGAFLQTLERLYPDGEFFWWIEARDAAGRVTGFTRMRSFRIASGSTLPAR
jgi:hypothetical protein